MLKETKHTRIYTAWCHLYEVQNQMKLIWFRDYDHSSLLEGIVTVDRERRKWAFWGVKRVLYFDLQIYAQVKVCQLCTYNLYTWVHVNISIKKEQNIVLTVSQWLFFFCNFSTVLTGKSLVTLQDILWAMFQSPHTQNFSARLWAPALTHCVQECVVSYLLQLLLSIFLATPLIFSALPQLLQSLGFLLGNVDLISKLLLQMDLFHLHCAVLLLGLVQPEGRWGSWRRPGKGVPATTPWVMASKRKLRAAALSTHSPYSADSLALLVQCQQKPVITAILILAILLLLVIKSVKLGSQVSESFL